MADVTLVDPLGRAFVLHDHTWHGHILKGHPEMQAHRVPVEQAVTAPLAIWFSNSGADARICYGNGPRAGVYVAVVIDVGLGIVKTAHLARRMTGASEEWIP